MTIAHRTTGLCLLFLLSLPSIVESQEAVRDPLRPIAVSFTFGPPTQTGTTVFYVDGSGLIRRVDALAAVPGHVPAEVRELDLGDSELLSRLELSRVESGKFLLSEVSTEQSSVLRGLEMVGRSLVSTDAASTRTWTTRTTGRLGSFSVFNPSGERSIAVTLAPDYTYLDALIADRRYNWLRDPSGNYCFAEFFDAGELIWQADIEHTRSSVAELRTYYPGTDFWGSHYHVEGVGNVTDAATAAINFAVLSAKKLVATAIEPYIFAPHLATDEGVNVVTSSVFTEVLGGERVYYLGKNLLDDDPSTAWVEGHPGDGVGEWVDLLVPEVSSFHSLTVRNGFQANAEWYHKNGRVRGYRILVDEVEVHRGELPDRMGEQEITFAPVEGQVLRFEVTSIYEGTHYTDLVISDLSVGYQ